MKNKKRVKFISLANQKGGVGKTALTFSIGRILAIYKGKRVLLVDADDQINLTSAFNINTDEQKFTLADVLLNRINKDNIQELFCKTDVKNLDILPSSIVLAEIEDELVTKTKREYRFMNFLNENYDYINEKYDYVLIDTKPQKGIINLNMFLVSDEIILVTDIDTSSVNGLKQQIQWWKYKRSSKELNEPELNNMNYIILNHVEERTIMYHEIESFFKQNGNVFLGTVTLENYISKTTTQKMTIARGQSLYEYNRRHKVSIQYMNLVNEMFERNIL